MIEEDASEPVRRRGDVRWVCLDIGETLVDETRVWTTWAAVVGVTPLVLHAALGVAIADGQSYPEALSRFDPSWRDRVDDFDAAYGSFESADLYPDALVGLAGIAAEGLGVAVIGNQPSRRSAELAALGVRPDVMAMSAELGASKPDDAFWTGALTAMGNPRAEEVVYVGDRMDNDIGPAHAHGLRTIHLRRGPWGLLGPQDDGTADAVVEDLGGVVAAVRGWRCPRP